MLAPVSTILDMPFNEDFDTMTLLDVALVASQLALQRTVTGRSHALGGIAPVRPKKLLHVELFGRVGSGARE